ncbi:MAG: hypothetical protein RIT27_1367 [Pseudomonadota bacterium]|jgi:hypothetical protein
MRKYFFISFFISFQVCAHHGIASLGVAGLEGPGAPIESSSSATLNQQGTLAYLKLEQVRFKTYTPEIDNEMKNHSYWIYGAGYGFTPYFSGYLFVPYQSKNVENNSFNTSGFTDISVQGVLGFKYDQGLKLIPVKESLDDLEDWHFTVYSGLSLPTGDANTKNSNGYIDGGMSLGFGKPHYSLGATATKQFGKFTLTLDSSYLYFNEYQYADKNKGKFGSEWRFNSALNYRLLTNAENKLRLDSILELNYLNLGRDKTNGEAEQATGGNILYATSGLRLYYDKFSLGLGLKIPIKTNLNEEPLQQGSEGKEKYRLLFSFSALL